MNAETSPNDGLGTSSWVLWSRSDADTALIQESLDASLTGYSFYPEVEWSQYGYRPPDGHQVLGAWRHPETISFVFLLDNPRMASPKSIRQLVVYAAGRQTEISRFAQPINRVKKELSKALKQQRGEALLQRRLTAAQSLKSSKRLMGLLCFFTVATNAFSLYLRRLPPPPIVTSEAASAYKVLLLAIHLSALLLLFSFIVICLIYTLKYGMLIVRKI